MHSKDSLYQQVQLVMMKLKSEESLLHKWTNFYLLKCKIQSFYSHYIFYSAVLYLLKKSGVIRDLVHLVVLMFLFKAVLFSICSGKISCNNNLNSKLNLRKSNLSELTNTQNVKRRIICFVFFEKRSKVCCNILHR